MKQEIKGIFLAFACACMFGAGCMSDDPKPTDVLQQYDRKANRDTLSTKPLIQTEIRCGWILRDEEGRDRYRADVVGHTAGATVYCSIGVQAFYNPSTK